MTRASLAAGSRPLDDVEVDLDAAIAEEALESGAPGSGIADRLGDFGFSGEAGQLLLPQIEERRDGGGGFLPVGPSPMRGDGNCCYRLIARGE